MLLLLLLLRYRGAAGGPQPAGGSGRNYSKLFNRKDSKHAQFVHQQQQASTGGTARQKGPCLAHLRGSGLVSSMWRGALLLLRLLPRLLLPLLLLLLPLLPGCRR